MGRGYLKRKRAQRRRDHLDAARAAAAAEEYHVAADILCRGRLKRCCICVEQPAVHQIHVVDPFACRGRKLPFCALCHLDHIRPQPDGAAIELDWRRRFRKRTKAFGFGGSFGRMPSQAPPMQNIPMQRAIQSAAPDVFALERRLGRPVTPFAAADYAGLERRLAAVHRALVPVHDEIEIEIEVEK